MIEPADLFELMHGAPASFRSVRGVIRERCEYEACRRARATHFESTDPDGWAGYLAEGGNSEGWWDDSEFVTRLWVERPDCLREETDMRGGRIRVRNAGGSWSSETTPRLELTSVASLVHGELFDPLPLVPVVHLDPVEEVEIAGRVGVRLRAFQREPESIGSWLANAEADEGELVIDLERGVVLRKAVIVDGEPAEVVEFTELEFDGVLDPGLFVLPAEQPANSACKPDIAPPRPPGEATIEQVAEEAPFPVFTLGAIWPRAHLHVSYFANRVWLSYSDIAGGPGEQRSSLSVQERAAAAVDEDAPASAERIEVGGREALSWVGAAHLDNERVRFQRHLRITREGTMIDFTAQGVSREELVALAGSLEPARTTPPRLR